MLHRDKLYFERKWSCTVINEWSRGYLTSCGVSEQQLARLERFPVFMKVTA